MLRSRGYKTFSMLNSAEHKIYPAQMLKCQHLLTLISMINAIILLINVKMSIIGILTFMSMINATSDRT